MDGATVGLAGLFLSAFTSATLLPGTSEAVLAGMALATSHASVVLLGVATAGNVLGSCVNWLMGRTGRVLLEGDGGEKPGMERAKRWYVRYGRWSLLASWVPVIGDPLTLVAGVMGEPFWRFAAIVTIAKAARYAAILALAG